jgi:8-oxo-dGTP pyrophosphatase MutT (NUDIX family)
MNNIEKYLKESNTYTKAVVGYMIKEDNVILGLRKKVSFGLGENLISGIGGKIGDIEGLENETAEEALKREFLEEIGVNPKTYHKVGEITFVFPNKDKWNQQVDAYLITDWEGEPVETDVIDPNEYPINNLPRKTMWDDNRYWVPRILAGEKIKAIFVYGDDNATVVDQYIGNV